MTLYLRQGTDTISEDMGRRGLQNSRGQDILLSSMAAELLSGPIFASRRAPVMCLNPQHAHAAPLAPATPTFAASPCDLPPRLQHDDQHPPVGQAQPRLIVAHRDTGRTTGLPRRLQISAGIQANGAPAPRGLLQAAAPLSCRQWWGTSSTLPASLKQKGAPCSSGILSQQPG